MTIFLLCQTGNFVKFLDLETLKFDRKNHVTEFLEFHYQGPYLQT